MRLKTKSASEIELMISSARNEYRKSKLDSKILAELKVLQNMRYVSVDALKEWLLELDGMYCLSELATCEKCDRYSVDKLCSLEEANDCDFRCVRVEIRKLLGVAEK